VFPKPSQAQQPRVSGHRWRYVRRIVGQPFAEWDQLLRPEVYKGIGIAILRHKFYIVSLAGIAFDHDADLASMQIVLRHLRRQCHNI
jgi:hypothetical protein